MYFCIVNQRSAEATAALTEALMTRTAGHYQ